MKKRKGISLMVLIITIVVVIILAAAVILTISKNNPVESAKKATFLSDISNYQDELLMYIGNEYTNAQGNYNIATLDDKPLEEIVEINSKYNGKFVILNGKIIGTDELTEQEKEWAQSIIEIKKVQIDINNINLEYSSNSIQVKVEYVGEITKFTYSISEDNSTWKDEASTLPTHTFTTNKINKKYYIKVKGQDKDGKTAEKVNDIISAGVYGDGAPTRYDNIYTSKGETIPNVNNYAAGGLASIPLSSYPVEFLLPKITDCGTPLLTTKSEYIFDRESNKNRWIHVGFDVDGTYTNLSNFRYVFSDGRVFTFKEMVDNKYIEPLYMIWTTANGWDNNMANGGNFGLSAWRGVHTIIKVRDVPLKAIKLSTNVNIDRNNGLYIREFSEEIDFSLEPFQ